MLDGSIVGAEDETIPIRVEPARLSAFAEAIGEERAIYLDADAARAAGYRNTPIPPTYHFSLGHERDRPLGLLEDRGVDLLRLLHGEQRFRYEEMAFADDMLTVARRVSNYFEKKDGALKFIVVETEIRNSARGLVSLGHETLVLPETAPAPNRRRSDVAPPLGTSGMLPPLRPGVVSRQMLARFGAASGDRNSIHLVREAARSVGYDDVIAHGMLSMAWLGRLLTANAPLERLCEFSVRFLAPMPIGARPICEGSLDADGRKLLLRVSLQDGTQTLEGHATLR